MHQHPYSVLTTTAVQGQLIFTPCPGTQDASVAEALDTLKAAGASAGSGRTGLIAAQLLIECAVPLREAVSEVQTLRPRAIQHPVHINYISQFDIAKS